MTRRRKKGAASSPREAPAQADRAASPPPVARAARAAAPVAARESAAAPVAVTTAPGEDRLQHLANRRPTRLAALALVLGFFAISAIVVAREDTPTPDEFVYVPAGYYHLETGDLSFDPTNPPLLKMIMALPLLAMDLHIDTDPRSRDNRTGWGPWIFGTSFMELNRDRYLDAFFRARLVIIAIGIVLGALLFARAREMLSPAAAIAALVLYGTMSPIIAHSALATLDIGVTAVMFAMLLAAFRFGTTKEWGWAIATGAAFGFAFAIKGTAALFAPLVPVLALIQWREWTRAGVVRLVAGGAVMAACAWLAIEAAYGFSGFPLPAPLLAGLKFQIAASSAGEYPAFLFGAWSPKGWWYYYLVALVLKTPLATLVLTGAGCAAAVMRRRREDLWIVLPPLLLLYVLSFHYAKDYGIRYMLPAFPFLVLLAGRGADLLLAAGRNGRAVLAGLLVWQTLACLVAAPYHLAYFNELAGGPDRSRQLLLDSNLDWGQDLGRLADYLHGRGSTSACIGYFGHVSPRVYGVDFTLPPPTPTPGLCAVSANFLAGYPYAITYAGEQIRGVRAGAWSWFDRLEPVARVGRSIYVYDVTADDARRLREGAAARP